MMGAKLIEQVKKIQNDEAFKRFVELLEEMFEFDKGDLDFGIYRILNTRKDKIHDFIYGVGQYDDKGLPQQIVKSMSFLNDKDDEALKKELDAKILQCKELGMSDEQINNTKGIIELRNQLNSGKDILSLQIEVYNILYDFFSRYYDKGDFISKRRYKKNVYSLPYNGEEVKLSWANEDQYYIKTVNNYNNYVFKDDKENGKWTIEFKVINALYEKDNNKENSKRVFMLYDKELDNNEEKKETFTIDKENKKVIISFVYDAPSEKYKSDIDKEGNSKVTFKNVANNLNYKVIEEYIKANITEIYDKLFTYNSKVADTSLFGKHLVKFYAKNQFDFFIHKDLKSFLNRELDNYIKTELVNINDIDENTKCNDLENVLVKIKVVKKIATVIIDELAEVEDFQKKLYLKKKFVVDTNYIITLDNICNEEIKKEICMNKEQRKDWIENFDAKEIIEKFDKANDLDDKDLNKLLVDTKYFDEEIKEKILNEIENIDNKINGILYNGDNFQTLNLIENKFENLIGSCYIDPPYNTEEDTFIYKDGYKNSSWISFINQVIGKIYYLMNENSCIFTSIDDNEVAELKMIYDNIFGENNFVAISPRKTRGSATTKSSAELQKLHDYIVCYWNDKKGASFNLKIKGEKKYPYTDERGKYYVVPLQDNGPHGTRTARPNLYYPIYVGKNKTLSLIRKSNDDIEILPFKHKNDDGCWMWSKKKFENENNDLIYIDNTIKIKHYYNENEDQNIYQMYNSWFDKYGNANGTNLLNNVMGEKGKFSNPKPVELIEFLISLTKTNNKFVLDSFAGSGTTGNAIINLNRHQKKEENFRKYMLIEMGTYFDTVLKKRIKKAIYSEKWNDGKPVDKTSISQIVKYHIIESYDDTLNNIKINDVQSYLSDGNLIKYTFDTDLNSDILDVNQFKNPFNYKMVIQIDNELKETNIDLVETFNYLIGLYVDRNYASYKINDIKFKLITGNLRTGEKVAIIWREIKDIKKSNDILNKFIDDNYGSIKDLDILYINGDSSINKLDLCDKVKVIESKFKTEMLDVEE